MNDIELGLLLKKAREEKNLTLADIQERTKIRKKYLKAIEENNFDILPAKIYLKVFVKGYAREVDINYEELLKYYPVLDMTAENDASLHKEYLNGEKVNHDFNVNNNRYKSFFKIIMIIIISLLLITAAVYTFQHFVNSEIKVLNQNIKEEQNIDQDALILENKSNNSEKSIENDKIDLELEKDLSALNNENQEDILNYTVPKILSNQSTEIINPDKFNKIEDINITENNKLTEITASDNLLEEASSTDKIMPKLSQDDYNQDMIKEKNPAKIEEETQTQVAQIDKNISFIASDTVWVNIRVDGATVFSGIMESGERKEFELDNKLYIKIGNASAIKAIVAGEESGPWSGTAGITEVEFTVKNNKIEINNLRKDS